MKVDDAVRSTSNHIRRSMKVDDAVRSKTEHDEVWSMMEHDGA
jgi:hypothetical protein